MNKLLPKFLHVACYRDANVFSVPQVPTGYYHWHKAFGGDFKVLHDALPVLGEYEIVFVCLTAPDCAGMTVSRIREKLPAGVKLIVSIDMAVELWQANFDLMVLRHELLAADMVFVAEPMMQSCVESLTGKPPAFVDHPADLEWLRSVERKKKLDWLAVFVHRYDNHWAHGYLVTHDLPWSTTAIFMDRKPEPAHTPFFDRIMPAPMHHEFIPWFATQGVAVDCYNTVHSIGRLQIEGACLGVPVIGCNMVRAQSDLWPALTTDPCDAAAQRVMVGELSTNPELYRHVCEYAAETVNRYGYTERVEELLNALEEHSL